MEIKVLAPIGQEDGWENLVPDTLQHMLEGVMFFRTEPAMVMTRAERQQED